MQDVELVRQAFTDPEEFWSSPLYRRLSAVVAAEPDLIALAAHARAGQGPTFAFFAAVQALLLDGVEHPLADHYPSLRGDRALAPEHAGPQLVSFAHANGEALRDLLQTKLVQTNHAQRAVGLRLGLAAVAESIGGRPAHLLEIGSSAGLVLRHADYGYRLGNRFFGQPASPVQLTTEWRSAAPIPDLDTIPAISSTTGIDLNPLDPSLAADRLWLEALVWPEDRGKAALLRDALALARRRPVHVLAGDAIDLCRPWSAALPAGQARIVFHCATRMHVPALRQTAFDAAIADLSADGPVYHLAIEGQGLVITGPTGLTTITYEVDGHLAWARPAAE